MIKTFTEFNLIDPNKEVDIFYPFLRNYIEDRVKYSFKDYDKYIDVKQAIPHLTNKLTRSFTDRTDLVNGIYKSNKIDLDNEIDSKISEFIKENIRK